MNTSIEQFKQALKFAKKARSLIKEQSHSELLLISVHNMIHRILKALLGSEEYKPRITFLQCSSRLRSLQRIDDETYNDLRRFNRIRNDYTHENSDFPVFDEALGWYRWGISVIAKSTWSPLGWKDELLKDLPPLEFESALFLVPLTMTKFRDELRLSEYQTLELGFAIQYPDIAEVTETNSSVMFSFLEFDIEITRHNSRDHGPFDPEGFVKSVEQSWHNVTDFTVEKRSPTHLHYLDGLLSEYHYKFKGAEHRCLYALGWINNVDSIISLDFSGPRKKFGFFENVFHFMISSFRFSGSGVFYSHNEAVKFVLRMLEDELKEKALDFDICDPDDEKLPYCLINESEEEFYPSILWSDSTSVVGAADICRNASITTCKVERWEEISNNVDDFRLYVPQERVTEVGLLMRRRECSLSSFRYYRTHKQFKFNDEWSQQPISQK